MSHAKGELTEQALDSILACGDQLEQTLAPLAPAKLHDIVGDLKSRLRR